MIDKKLTRKGSIQRVEIESFCYSSIHCPFCGKRVVENEDDVVEVDPCEHTIFIAHDEGFEYRSDRFDENLGISEVDENDLSSMFGEDVAGIDGITDLVDMPDSIKFASYVPAPSFFGAYCGFAAIEDD